MSIQTSVRSVLCCALILVAACEDADSHSKTSPTTAVDAAAVDASPPSAAGSGAGGGQIARTEPFRIVPLGDSITEGSCTSQLLWQNLREAGANPIDMIGTRHSDQDCGVPDADRDNEGHSGYLAIDMVDDGPHAAELSAWCKADRGDIVLMHLGTNDIWHRDLEASPVLEAFSKILESLRAVQPNVIVFVAQIIPMSLGDCHNCAARVQQFNEQIPAWAARESREDSPVYVVDQFTGFEAAADTGDGVHPNKTGAKKMADKWSAALLKRLGRMLITF